MTKSRIVRIACIGLTAASAVFVVAIIIGGGTNTVPIAAVPVHGLSPLTAPLKPIKNLTELATDKISEQIIAQPEKSGVMKAQPNPSQIANSALLTSIQSFEPSDLLPLIKSSSFVIAPTNTDEAKRIYLSQLAAILKSAGGEIPQSSTDVGFPDFSLAFTRYADAGQQLLALPVPRDFIEIHRQAIDMVGIQKNILAILKNHNVDPVRAYLASQNQTMVSENLNTLNAEINSYLYPSTDET